jgi:dTDP-4-dehydro-6-deoxy-alpha-D-glucopyranose 2,3-dehydratase
VTEVTNNLRDYGVDVSARFLRSARVLDSPIMPLAKFADWLAMRTDANNFDVDRIALSDLRGWSFESGSDNLRHDSGKFFSVEGVRVRTDGQPPNEWVQPIIVQPEVGILGILVKEFGGVLHFLMQAKMEPGNINLVQLSPTVQATRSNYTGVHRGASIRYIEVYAKPQLFPVGG